ncbi:hypothetical protein [Desulfovibrio sp. ZJ200]|uniref:hypothetical protein n=1 Tax=Desulfovibrio sp. ZJ200 TaxID=2709792 RepID=UPI0013EE3CDD|nr:hypothetical protein [Desulfovibrio sp. ZJ200]
MAKQIVTLCLLLAFCLCTGCANQNVPRIDAHYYRQCVSPLVEMQHSTSHLYKETTGAALMGALGGAVIGIIVTPGNIVGPLVGAAVGAGTGAAVGYSFAKLQQIHNENTRFASIRITANQDLTEANRLQLYAYECMECYMAEFEKLRNAYENGQILKPEYSKRYAEIRKAMQQLGQIIGNMEQEIARTENEFTSSFTVAERAQRADAARAKTATPSPVSSASAARQQGANKPIKAVFAENRARVEKAQASNDDDLTVMLETFAGKAIPPKQDAHAIASDYGQGYAETRQQIESLKVSHLRAMEIMDKAAVEAGIDMV